MLCLKADTSSSLRRNNGDEESDLYDYNDSPSPVLLPLNNIIQRCIRRGARKSSGWKSRLSDASSFTSNGSAATAAGTGSSSSGLEMEINDQDVKTSAGENHREHKEKMCAQRSQLEQEVKTLHKQLEEEIDLRLALASASDNSVFPFSNPLCQLPDEARDILAEIDVLEITISKLEEESVALQFQLSQERNERRLVQYRLRQMPSSPSPHTHSPASPKEVVTRLSKDNRWGSALDDLLLQTDAMEWKKETDHENLRQQPNQLSEEMVRCMRNILLCIADSSNFSSSGCMASPISPKGPLSNSCNTSLSDSSSTHASKESSLFGLEHGILAKENTFDPYRVQGKLNWTKYIGAYSIAAEVSTMSVGEKQLKYAAGALKRFRLLVEQLANVNPASMNTNERLAFWINLYNTLIMHGYLAYGVPGSESKFFSLTKKAAYTVGGISLSAVDIEYIILKMKPVHRPQITLVHKFKLLEEKQKYAIENSEPLVAFALSCGMHSSPAVRIFRPENVMEDLQNSLKDYIQASVGISNKGKLLVPKLLHCYTKGVVEDSMLPDWICRFLSFEQAAMVRDCSSPRKQRLLSPRSFTVQSFDSTFRYLFLPENRRSCQS